MTIKSDSNYSTINQSINTKLKNPFKTESTFQVFFSTLAALQKRMRTTFTHENFSGLPSCGIKCLYACVLRTERKNRTIIIDLIFSN